MENIKKDLMSIGKWSNLYLNGKLDEVDLNTRKAVERYLNKGFEQGIYLTGQFGTGKSTLVGLIAIWLRANKMELTHYVTASSLFDLLVKGEDGNLRYKHNLLIDDLGRQYNSDYGISKFNEFIEYRYSNGLKTFITSNMDIETLKKVNGFERVADLFSDKKFMYEFKLLGNSKRK